MALNSLSTFPETPEDLARFSFAHMDLHRRVNVYLFNQLGKIAPEFALDPMPVDDLRVFLQHHQKMHDITGLLLNISPPDLTVVDWRDKGDRENWIWQNYTLHQLEAHITGVT